MVDLANSLIGNFSVIISKRYSSKYSIHIKINTQSLLVLDKVKSWPPPFQAKQLFTLFCFIVTTNIFNKNYFFIIETI